MANGPARPCPTRPDTGRANMGRRAYRAVPLRASCLAFGPGTALWAVFRAVPARLARLTFRVVPAHGPVTSKYIKQLTIFDSNQLNSQFSSQTHYTLHINRIIRLQVTKSKNRTEKEQDYNKNRSTETEKTQAEITKMS